MQLPGATYQAQDMQVAAVATGPGTAVDTIDRSNGAWTLWMAQVEGVTTATIAWEATLNGTDWHPVMMTNTADGEAATTVEDANGLYAGRVVGYNQVRARIHAWTTGTINVIGYFT